MNDFTFVHAADIHLDSALSGLARRDPEFSGLVREATRRAFVNVVDLAIREGAALLVIAGDLYDGTWKDHGTGQFAAAQLARLSRSGVRTFIVFGNHDAESRVSRHFAPPEGVHRFDNKRCETVLLDDLGVAVHGRSYKDAATTEDMAASYCAPVAGRFNIAILHTSLDGHPGHANYAPCTLERLRATRHDYWALGHVHERGVRCEHPHVVFPGNTQGRHIRETGVKGAFVVRVRDGVVVEVRHQPCDEVRWARANFNAGSGSNMGEMLAGLGAVLARTSQDQADRPVAARVSVTAGGALHRQLVADRGWFEGEVQALARSRFEQLWIESVRIEARAEAAASTILPELAELLAAAIGDPDCGRVLLGAVAPLLGKLSGDDADAELTPLLCAARAGDAQALLAATVASIEARLAQSHS